MVGIISEGCGFLGLGDYRILLDLTELKLVRTGLEKASALASVVMRPRREWISTGSDRSPLPIE